MYQHRNSLQLLLSACNFSIEELHPGMTQQDLLSIRSSIGIKLVDVLIHHKTRTSYYLMKHPAILGALIEYCKKNDVEWPKDYEAMLQRYLLIHGTEDFDGFCYTPIKVTEPEQAIYSLYYYLEDLVAENPLTRKDRGIFKKLIFSQFANGTNYVKLLLPHDKKKAPVKLGSLKNIGLTVPQKKFSEDFHFYIHVTAEYEHGKIRYYLNDFMMLECVTEKITSQQDKTITREQPEFQDYQELFKKVQEYLFELVALQQRDMNNLFLSIRAQEQSFRESQELFSNENINNTEIYKKLLQDRITACEELIKNLKFYGTYAHELVERKLKIYSELLSKLKEDYSTQSSLLQDTPSTSYSSELDEEVSDRTPLFANRPTQKARFVRLKTVAQELVDSIKKAEAALQSTQKDYIENNGFKDLELVNTAKELFVATVTQAWNLNFQDFKEFSYELHFCPHNFQQKLGSYIFTELKKETKQGCLTASTLEKLKYLLKILKNNFPGHLEYYRSLLAYEIVIDKESEYKSDLCVGIKFQYFFFQACSNGDDAFLDLLLEYLGPQAPVLTFSGKYDSKTPVLAYHVYNFLRRGPFYIKEEFQRQRPIQKLELPQLADEYLNTALWIRDLIYGYTNRFPRDPQTKDILIFQPSEFEIDINKKNPNYVPVIERFPMYRTTVAVHEQESFYYWVDLISEDMIFKLFYKELCLSRLEQLYHYHEEEKNFIFPFIFKGYQVELNPAFIEQEEHYKFFPIPRKKRFEAYDKMLKSLRPRMSAFIFKEDWISENLDYGSATLTSFGPQKRLGTLDIIAMGVSAFLMAVELDNAKCSFLSAYLLSFFHRYPRPGAFYNKLLRVLFERSRDDRDPFFGHFLTIYKQFNLSPPMDSWIKSPFASLAFYLMQKNIFSQFPGIKKEILLSLHSEVHAHQDSIESFITIRIHLNTDALANYKKSSFYTTWQKNLEQFEGEIDRGDWKNISAHPLFSIMLRCMKESIRLDKSLAFCQSSSEREFRSLMNLMLLEKYYSHFYQPNHIFTNAQSNENKDSSISLEKIASTSTRSSPLIFSLKESGSLDGADRWVFKHKDFIYQKDLNQNEALKGTHLQKFLHEAWQAKTKSSQQQTNKPEHKTNQQQKNRQ